MKLLIASDIHGSVRWCRSLMERIEQEDPAKVVLLGDVLYHGPRNALPDEYDPRQVADMLNSISSRVIAVRGNCDAEVDQMLLEFPCLADYALLYDGETDLTLFATHGHVYGPDALPPHAGRFALLSGHTHVKVDEERDGIRFVNPGSVSIPKDGSNSYAVYEDGAFELKTLD